MSAMNGTCRCEAVAYIARTLQKLHDSGHFQWKIFVTGEAVTEQTKTPTETIGTEKDDDHDQDSLEKALRHIWSWSSENLPLAKKTTMTMTKIPLRKTRYTYGHGPLIKLEVPNFACSSDQRRREAKGTSQEQLPAMGSTDNPSLATDRVLETSPQPTGERPKGVPEPESDNANASESEKSEEEVPSVIFESENELVEIAKSEEDKHAHEHGCFSYKFISGIQPTSKNYVQ